MDIKWDERKGVPITEAKKLKWIKECIQRLKDNPKEWWYGTSSGDTYIKVTKHKTFYMVEEFEPRKTGYIDRDEDEADACNCSLDTLNKSGCKCGGI
jgi:hypothetical protein